jgi:hypothetical protein
MDFSRKIEFEYKDWEILGKESFLKMVFENLMAMLSVNDISLLDLMASSIRLQNARNMIIVIQ